MPTFFARSLGLDLALASAVMLGVAGHLLWGEQPAVPLIRLPIPMSLLFPILTSLLLTWPLHERWPSFMRTSSRGPFLVPAVRFAATQLSCLLSSFIAGLGDGAVQRVMAVASIGASLGAVLVLVLDRYAAFGILLAGYLWLSAVAAHPSIADTAPVLPIAGAALAVSALAFLCMAWIRRPTRRPT